MKKPFYNGFQEDAHEFFMQLMEDADPKSVKCAKGEHTKEHTDEEFMKMFKYEQQAQIECKSCECSRDVTESEPLIDRQVELWAGCAIQEAINESM